MKDEICAFKKLKKKNRYDAFGWIIVLVMVALQKNGAIPAFWKPLG